MIIFFYETLSRLLERDEELETTSAMFKIVKKSNVMCLLLRHRSVCELSSDILKAVAEQFKNSLKCIKLFLKHDPKILITEVVVVAALQKDNSFYDTSLRLLDLLFDSCSKLEVIEVMLKAAMRPAQMKLLLEHMSKCFSISFEVLEAAAASRYDKFREFISLLLEHDKSINITLSVVLSAIKDLNYLSESIKILLEHGPILEISSEQFLSSIESMVGPFQ